MRMKCVMLWSEQRGVSLLTVARFPSCHALSPLVAQNDAKTALYETCMIELEHENRSDIHRLPFE